MAAPLDSAVVAKLSTPYWLEGAAAAADGMPIEGASGRVDWAFLLKPPLGLWQALNRGRPLVAARHFAALLRLPMGRPMPPFII